STFHAGGKVAIVQSEKFQLAGNYLNLFDVSSTLTDTSRSARNPVTSFELNANLANNSSVSLDLTGESGFSQLNFKNDTLSPAETKGAFMDGQLMAHLKNIRLKLSAGYSYVHPYFFSSAAQTKRIHYENTPALFPVYGNDVTNLNLRFVTLFDLVRDFSIYNAGITYRLMAYNPIYGNTLAYGRATPNRQGINAGLTYADSTGLIKANLKTYLMNEVVPEGTVDSKRKFSFNTITIDFYLNKLIGFKKNILISGGISLENTKRNGDTSDAIQLKSNMIDAGLEIEALKKFDILIGVKILSSRGNEFLAVRNIYNRIVSFQPLQNINLQQNMLGYGVRYRFSKATYLSLNYHTFAFTDKSNNNKTYNMNQWYILFNLSL
ncbi:MAG: hypothetical protein NZ529_11585, partial [Cytophagaceae bacterium]|nr:hypothetical protein [Cytophagaceae bacterium]MDW8457426.1 hypothetical protein [Cytophagaceae bacterium]